MSPWQNRRIPAFRSTRVQSSQLSSLSWQYALLLPSCVRRTSSPIVTIGTPTARSSIASRFLTWRLRNDSIAGIVRGALDAAVPAQVLVVAVAVAFAVRLVVLLVVRDGVVEREPVVAGDEVDRLLGLAVEPGVDVGARPAGVAAIAQTLPGSPLTNDRTSSRKRPFHSTQRSPANEPTWYRPAASHASAISFVPARIGSVSMSQMTGGRGTGSAVLVARQHRREIEAEPVHVHLRDPVAEAVEDQPPDDRLVGVERVAGAAVVGVAGAVGAVRDVVLLVREAAVAERRAIRRRPRRCGCRRRRG